MGKKLRNLAALSLASAFAGGCILAGGYLYRLTCMPRKKGDAEQNARTKEGRRYVRNHPDRQEHYINSIDNLRLHAVMLPGGEQEHRYAVCIHGVWSDGEEMGDVARHYTGLGYHVLLPDLRGHGKSEGRYIGYGYDDRLDILEWIYWIIRRDPEAKILLHGVSMGAATTLMVTGERLPDNVRLAISDSSYTSAIEEFMDVYEDQVVAPVLPKRLAMFLLRMEILLRAGYDIRQAAPVEAVKRSATPTLFLHGDADTFVKPQMCTQLYAAAACEKRYTLILGAGHVEGGYVDHDKYWRKIEDFIGDYM